MIDWCPLCLEYWHLCDCRDASARAALSSPDTVKDVSATTPAAIEELMRLADFADGHRKSA